MGYGMDPGVFSNYKRVEGKGGPGRERDKIGRAHV